MKETKIYFSKELNAVVCEFNGFLKTEKFIEFGFETNNLLVKHSAQKQLNNVQNMKVLTKEAHAWVDEVWYPKAKASGLKHFAFVVPKDVFGKASMDAVNVNIKEKYGINIKYFTDVEEAKQWLISQ
ncbi:MAG: hypothetical protein GQ564_09385 [Bacteroidales bacterium]|nr:hypothetical protein [Bacteroidales bacterium]